MSYHDYVIKDGKWVGRFEEMYKDCSDPWNQSAPECHELSKPRNIAILHMKKYGVKSVLEVGSGLGFYTKMIAEQGIRPLGLEISETAVQKAKERFPDLEFAIGDLSSLPKWKGLDAVLLAEVTWYILDQLPTLYDNLFKHFSGKYLLQNLTFYPPQEQKYGREHFTTFEEFVQKCPLKLLEYTVSKSTIPNSITGTSSIFKIERK